MKRYILVIALFFTVSVAFAVFINDFKNWDDLTERSPDIIVARCTSTLGSAKTEKPTLIIDGMIPSDIDVVSVLKGSTQAGLSHMASQYWPYPGEEFLLFANYENDRFYKGYTAVEDYRVVPMSRFR
jgi:hypothetical protein